MTKKGIVTKKQERSIHTRELIIKTGLKLFATEGFYETSTKKIAKAAGISIGNFYNYFKDKKELIIEIFKRNIEKAHSTVIEAIQAVDIASQDKRQILRTIIDISLKTHNINPDFHREITRMKFSDHDIRAIHEVEEKKIQSQFILFLMQYKDDLRVADIEASAAVLVMTIEEVTHALTLFERPPMEAERMIDALIDMAYTFLFKE